MRILAFICGGLLSLLSLQAQAAPLQVVASFSILGDLVKQIGGEHVEVKTLVGPDGDAHVFQPTPADAKTITASSIVFVNGLGFEGWMGRLVSSANFKGKLVTVSDGIAKPLMMEDEHRHGEEGHGAHEKDEHHNEAKPVTDPHAWQSLTNGRLYVQNIAKALSAADAANATSYKAKADALDKELATLDVWVKTEIAKLPASKRKVISSHDAFGYFASAYGVTFMAPVGISTEAEPSAKGMKKLIEQIKHEGVKAIFFENMASAKLVNQLASEAGAAVGQALYADALSPANGPAATYQAMFKYNVTHLVEAMKTNR